VSRHVLLVEDSELVTDALCLLLEAHGHRVRVAGTVAAAMAALDDPPDFIFLDLSLPDGSGLEVARRAMAGAEPRPLIHAMTGHDDPVIADACRAAGCLSVMVKPVTSRDLLGVLNA
jgi:DNA-binding response OmpR family regulator